MHSETTSTMKISSVTKIQRTFFRNFIQNKWLYLMMVPGIAFYIIYKYIPMMGLLIAFQDYNIMKGIMGSPWVGFKHFETIFSSPDFYVLLRNTMVISLYKIVFGMLPDIAMALALNEIRSAWFKRTIQTITYAPHFLSWVIIYGLVMAFLATDSGLVNQWVRGSGGESINFLTSNSWFRPLLVLTEIWKDTGFGAIIYLAALTGIDPQLYEAAIVDGAGRWKQIWHITLPGIRNVIVLLLLLKIGHILDAGFGQIYIFLNTRVYETGDIIDTWVFRRGLESMEFSFASAVGFFKSFVGLVLVLGANKLAKKYGDSGIW
ncbi:putative multiple-sugar transport system permease YteP [Paenibacillus allorhizoplanae]|uniref:Multiple-sugar transport system permease YteP n=1 Tax=Paenibacillus allorhizoplanae TaxID=2905648 RepID=A0ABN8H804_9BACL|nr:ABC transporter permease subunit [Paenibacillus allorhizoplanae]CAH1226932.1 putative multiple-sugar transport system permease YteP [Paenibacillus allorhizoplanae]